MTVPKEEAGGEGVAAWNSESKFALRAWDVGQLLGRGLAEAAEKLQELRAKVASGKEPLAGYAADAPPSAPEDPETQCEEPEEPSGEAENPEACEDSEVDETSEEQDEQADTLACLIGPHLAWRAAALELQEGLHVAAVHIAAQMGGEDLRWEFHLDMERLEAQVQSSLQGLVLGLEACAARLRRLYVDFDCLDDGEAEGLFGSEGRLKEELQEIEDVQQDGLELRKRTAGWQRGAPRALRHVMGLEALADFLGEAVPEMDHLVAACGNCAARRRAAVARAKAAIEANDAEERASAVGLVQEALSPPSRVDFPRITEICQRVADRPDEAEQSAALLWAAFASDEDNAEVPRRQLKALTIAHELLYDERVLKAFAKHDTEALRGLEASRPTSLGAPAEEAMRMLAAEVRRRVEEARERTSRRRATWSFSVRGEGEGSSQPRIKSSKSMPLEVNGSFSADLEALQRRLRRWGSWYRFKGEELPLLEDLRQRLRGLLDALARLREELDCLDDGSTGLRLSQAVQELAPLLLAASDLQAKASGWCQVLAAGSESSPCRADPEGLDAEPLADFIEEALGAIEALQAQHRRFAELRREAVERAKASIEAGPSPDFEEMDPRQGKGFPGCSP